MGNVGFVNIAASVRLGRDDVVFRIGKVEPVLRAVVELEPDFRASIVHRDVVAGSHVEHGAVTIDRSFERIGHEPAKGSRNSVGTGSRVVAADVQVHVFHAVVDVHSKQVDGAQVSRRRIAHYDRGVDRIPRERVHRKNEQAVEAIGHVEGVSVGCLDESLVGAVQVQVGTE